MKPVLTFLIFFFALQVNAQSKVTYVANEGVLIDLEGKKVLIDALFDDFYKDYLSPDEETINRMMESQEPYNQIDVVLATHIHRDHFEAQIAGRFMTQHKESQLLSSEQIVKELEAKVENYDAFKSRVTSKTRVVEKLTDEVNGVTIHSFFIYHAGGERTRSIENMGFIVESNGKRVLHLGDADMDVARFAELDFTQYDLDVALVPYWYMADETGRKIVDDHIKAKKLVGVHYPKAPSPMALQDIRTNYPKATVFHAPNEQVRF